MAKQERDLPRGWVTCTIDQLVRRDGVFTDGDWVESKDQDPAGEVRLIQLADIGDGHFTDKSSRFLTKSKAYELKCTFLRRNDLLVARMPEPLGRACIFPLDGDERYVTVVDVCAIRVGSESAHPKFILHLINSPEIRAQIEEYKSGSTRKRISRKNLARIRLPIAPRREQDRIVAKVEELFSELDKGVESLQTAGAQLTAYRQAVLKHAFEGRLTAGWRKENKDKLVATDQLRARIKKYRELRHSKQVADWKTAINTAQARGEKTTNRPKPRALRLIRPLTHSELTSMPDLPAGWFWDKLGWMTCGVEYGTGAKSSESGDVPVLRMGNIQNAKIDWSDLVYTSDQAEIGKYLLRPGDVLFNRTNSPELVGKTAVYRGERPALFAGYLIRVNHIQTVVDGQYLNFFLNSHIAKQHGNRVKTDGVNQSNIKAKSFRIIHSHTARWPSNARSFEFWTKSSPSLIKWSKTSGSRS